jgi:multiple sugar transport system permease protein
MTALTTARPLAATHSRRRRPDIGRWLFFAAFLLVTIAIMLPVIIIALTADPASPAVDA